MPSHTKAEKKKARQGVAKHEHLRHGHLNREPNPRLVQTIPIPPKKPKRKAGK